MGRYRGNPDAVRALVREGEVHRDVYTDPEVFEIEMEQVFGNTWVYVGHASQVPNVADFSAEIGRSAYSGGLDIVGAHAAAASVSATSQRGAIIVKPSWRAQQCRA